MTQRSRFTRRSVLAAGGSALTATVALPGITWAQTPKRGGTLRVTNGGDPPDFDLHQAVTYLTQFIGAPCYSTLLKADPEDYTKLVSDLAEKYEVSSDGKTVTF